ncbi:serine/threonine-protein kinase [Rathayibacter sp. VKM Ac-2857]|uniref:serine/threonine-protein kinase n=1 Tax=Rathayibacter sp. VKM Ac-2857 TaxID=2739020 RepID=UPI001565D67F|nr:serine/threonine-protein kinase [Rathayibacter sp. VKM Ac-2857]NQX16053.1 serine/threonine protein kinase [Rathayibacter sp. VKM Ac-2857]
MSAPRSSPPPAISGFEFRSPLGSGGFADVFLYEQARPRRTVAVKVLRAGLTTDRERDAFEAEANLMASLSTHPSIVTIYQADIAADGRPYLAMEYCPNPNLAVRLKSGRLAVADALRIGIQVAGAVETVHRAGILHRDIKPANVLVTAYDRPALTDFGIAGALLDGSADLAGLSIPWSPPEAFGAEIPNEVALDVYALGATVYSLLAGRSPFELPGRSINSHELIERIRSAPLPPLGRADAPASLDRVLGISMAKTPQSRFTTALEFGRALQRIQVELSLAVTTADVLDDALPQERVEEEDDGNTRIRGIVSIDPVPRPVAPRKPAPALAEISGVPAFDLERTVARGSAAAFVAPAPLSEPRAPIPQGSPVPSGPAPARRRRPLVLAGIAVLVAASVAGGAALVAGLPTSTADPRRTTAAEAPADPLGQVDVPAVTGLAGAVGADGVVFTWSNPQPEDGDRFLWAPAGTGSIPDPRTQEESTVTVPADASGQTCLEVTLLRQSGRASAPTTACAP